MPNWDLIKTEYEILGKDVTELAEAHDVSPGILAKTIETQGWERGGGADLAELHDKHQETILPKVIEIETLFLDRLKKLAGSFEDAKEAKTIAETITLLKPPIMTRDEAHDNRIMIVNQFDTPQPGDAHYIAPNAAVMGDHARKNNGITPVDIEVVQIPGPDELN